ncbi:MAG: site-specific integrase, partial [Ignavibacteriae bacterium]|nr:site-specific integrase [Ignavibacteriota bacterium]
NKFSKYLGKIELHEITAQQCENFIMQNYNNAKFMSNLFYKNLNAFFNWSVENDYLELSPMLKVKSPKIPIKNPEWLTERELVLVFENVKNKNLIPIYKLLFYTGLRANELLSLNWENIDIENRLFSIKNENGFQNKTQIDKILPINQKAYEIFLSLSKRNNTGLIFKKNGIKLNVDYISKHFKKAVRETKLNQNLHLQSLRHSFASNLVAKGASLYHVSKLLSHSRISTTEKYSHVKMKELRETSEFI